MPDKLYAILEFTGIPVDGTQTLPHGLTINGQVLVPDFVSPQYPGTFEVTSTTTSGITLHNVSSASGNCLVWCYAIHPVARSFGAPPDDGNIHQHLTPQPFVLGSPNVPAGSFDQFNVKNFGAIGDGVHDDTGAINRAMAAAALVQLSGAFGAMVFFPKGVYSVSAPVQVPDGVGLQGVGTPGSVIRASATFNGTALVQNLHQDGTQEFMFVEGLTLDGNHAAGAVCSTAVLDIVSIFVNSFVRDVEILNGSSVGLHVGALRAMGPILFDNIWVANNLGDGIWCQEMPGNVGACDGLLFLHTASEHQGSNHVALRLTGLGSASGWSFINLHIEQGQIGATSQTCIVLDGVPDVFFDNVQLLTGNAPQTTGIVITNAVQNVRYQFRGIENANLINPVISDLKNSVTWGAIGAIPWYVAPDVVMRGGLRFLPAATSGSKSVAFQNAGGTDAAWFDDQGMLIGNSLDGALDVAANSADGATGRVMTWFNHAQNRGFGFYFPDGNFFTFRYVTGGTDVFDIDNSGFMRVLTLLTIVGALKGTATHTAPPSTGAHGVGEIVFNADPIAGGFIGWVCVTAGTPGTWKTWGVISP